MKMKHRPREIMLVVSVPGSVGHQVALDVLLSHAARATAGQVVGHGNHVVAIGDDGAVWVNHVLVYAPTPRTRRQRAG